MARTKEEIQEYQRRYYQEHKKEVLEYQRKYREANREKYNECIRNSRLRHPESHAEAVRRWNEKHPGYYKQWMEKNKEELNRRRREKRKTDYRMKAREQLYNFEYYRRKKKLKAQEKKEAI